MKRSSKLKKGPQSPGMSVEEIESKVPPKLKKEMEVYNGGLSNLLHNKATREDVYEMLNSAPPNVSIPQATLVVNERMEEALVQRGKLPSLEVRLSGGVFLISEMIDMGNEAGIFRLDKERDLPKLLEPTMKEYIQRGIKKGTVDPIELQQSVEPLMSEDQRAQGLEAGQALGVPEQAGTMAAMESYSANKARVQERRAQAPMPQAGAGNQGALQSAENGGQV